MATKVRLTDAEEWPHHGTLAKNPVTLEAYAKWRGQPILVGAPVPLDSDDLKRWKCGTDLLWPVLTPEVLADVDKPRAFVCRHQIQAGD